MKANDLRINNLVIDPGIDYDAGGNKFRDRDGDTILKVMAVSGGNISAYYCNKLLEFNLVDIEPIPLTEEWLLKFGFRFEDKNNDYWINGSEFYVNHNKTTKQFWLYMQNGDEDACMVTIDYVHQLQNLFYYLCGEELPIKD